MRKIDPRERAELAALAKVNEQYLYQCLTRRANMDAKLATAAEAATGGRLRRWQLRDDWHLIWPELIGTEGAPAVPAATSTAGEEVRDAA